MAKLDVIALIFDSFDLIRAHYREVAFPLVALLLLSGAGSFGGSSFSKGLDSRGWQDSTASGIANALSGSGALMAGLAGALLLIILFVIVVTLAIAVLSTAIWYYVCEHFYAILNKKKITLDWQSRMKRHLPKAFILALLEVVMIVVFAASLFACLFVVQTSWVAAAALFLLILIIGLNVGFYLIPVWVYYVLDNLPLFESISRSIMLVKNNVFHFAIFAAIFVLLTMGAFVGSLSACCFAFIVMPVLMVFVTLLSRVTLMKMKLAAEKELR
jgi:hypothetical protein